MSLSGLKQQLKNHIQSMVNEGILVDKQFAQVQDLKNSENPKFLSHVLNDFYDAAEASITSLNNLLGEEQVQFHKFDSCTHQLKGSSSTIGAHHLRVASVELIKAADEKNLDKAFEAMKKVTAEYQRIQYKLQTIILLENKICDIESGAGGNLAAGPSYSKHI